MAAAHRCNLTTPRTRPGMRSRTYLANGDLAWLAQDRPGFESDRFHVMMRDAHTGAVRSVTGKWDHSVAKLGSSPDGRDDVVSCDDTGQRGLFTVDPRSGAARRIVGAGEVEDFSVGRTAIFFAHADLGSPSDLYSVAFTGGVMRRLTHVNAELRPGGT